MAKPTPREIALELIATTIAETMEAIHDLSVTALPRDLRSYQSTARRLGEAGRDVAILATAMEVLLRRA